MSYDCVNHLPGSSLEGTLSSFSLFLLVQFGWPAPATAAPHQAPPPLGGCVSKGTHLTDYSGWPEEASRRGNAGTCHSGPAGR